MRFKVVQKYQMMKMIEYKSDKRNKDNIVLYKQLKCVKSLQLTFTAKI